MDFGIGEFLLGSLLSGATSGIGSALSSKSKNKSGGAYQIQSVIPQETSDVIGYLKAIPEYSLALEVPNLASYYYNLGVVNSMLHGGDPTSYMPVFPVEDTASLDAEAQSLMNRMKELEAANQASRANIDVQRTRNAERGSNHDRDRIITEESAAIAQREKEIENLSKQLEEINTRKKLSDIGGQLGRIINPAYSAQDLQNQLNDIDRQIKEAQNALQSYIAEEAHHVEKGKGRGPKPSRAQAIARARHNQELMRQKIADLEKQKETIMGQARMLRIGNAIQRVTSGLPSSESYGITEMPEYKFMMQELGKQYGKLAARKPSGWLDEMYGSRSLEAMSKAWNTKLANAMKLIGMGNEAIPTLPQQMIDIGGIIGNIKTSSPYRYSSSVTPQQKSSPWGEALGVLGNAIAGGINTALTASVLSPMGTGTSGADLYSGWDFKPKSALYDPVIDDWAYTRGYSFNGW